MNLKLIFTVIIIQFAGVSVAQTEDQKQMMYEYINQDSKVNSKIIPKIESINNKEDLFKKALILPVYRVEFDEKKEPKLVQNKNYYMVFYVDRLYTFLNGKNSRLFENRPEITSITKLLNDSKQFSIVYFTDSFSPLGIFLDFKITDNAFSYLIDKEIQFNTVYDYVNQKYGTMEKYEENISIDKKRSEINLDKIKESNKNNYHKYEYYCPKDTSLVIKTFMNQIKLATLSFTEEQETKLGNMIRVKINPFLFLQNKMGKFSNEKNAKDLIEKSKKENEEALNKVIKFKGDYDFSIYGVSVLNELLEVLSNKQFQDYKDFQDIYFPIVELNNPFSSTRYSYAMEVLEREGYKDYNNYVENILNQCGCPYDESIKREIKFR